MDKGPKVGSNLTSLGADGLDDSSRFDDSSSPNDDETNTSRPDETSTSSNAKEENVAATMAYRENRNVVRSKLLVFTVLLVAAALVGFFTYWFLSQSEKSAFESQFHDFQTEIIESANTNAEAFLGKLVILSNTVTSYAIGANMTWPEVTVQNFDIVTSSAFETALGPELFLFAPVVPDVQQNLWEHYAVEHQNWIKEDLELKGLDGNAPGNISEEIYAYNYDKESARFVNFSLPLWQMGPVPTSSDIIMMDLYSQASFRRMVDDAYLVRHILLSEVVDRTFFWDDIEIDGSNSTHKLEDPRSFAIQPVFDSFSDHDADITAFLFAVVPWNTYFADILPYGIEGFVVQVNDTCGSNFAYLLNGPETEFLGESFRPDKRYEHLSETADFAAFTRFNDTSTYTQSEILHCAYTLSVYATDTYASSFETEKPLYLMAVVLTVFLFTALVFVLYDWMVQRRQKKVMRAAQKSTAIISSLFPKNVRNRIIADAMEDDSSPKKSRLSSTGRDKLRSFFDGEDYEEGNGASTFDKPIADFFPDTTIMFGDLVGFTAWSSTREPSQVFTLLETIYNKFDRIAKARKVFKVETIGDCYVAVAGLPDPRKDHAVVMARFSRDCMVELQRMTKELEVTLGPDTADLRIRIGLHSGPVTAGVLRGERARFQLFGDTMNTASRMESTGVPNRIHVSSHFVQCLREHGKRHWVTERKDTVYAKGKGQLQTFFLDFNKDGIQTNSDTTSSNGAADASTGKMDAQKATLAVKLPHSSSTDIASKKCERLVNWNVDVLTGLLKEIVASRQSHGITAKPEHVLAAFESQQASLETQNVITEVQEVIKLPAYTNVKQIDPDSVTVDAEVLSQLRQYVTCIAGLYQENPFHNFEHASHVTMSVVKLLSRIIAPDLGHQSSIDTEENLHDHTYGITSDPLTRFSVILSALIHDADHPGVPNSQLVKEDSPVAKLYKNKSIAEQNSVDLAWDLLHEPDFKDLRRCICQTESEMIRFRQLIVNTVLATDIMDKDLKTLRNDKWDKAFEEPGSGESNSDVINRKATIVIEHLIQASDVAHTMQHWHIYQKWNARLFEEMYKAFIQGRADKNPADFWYQGEIGFFDFYIIPLARKLKECGVFGVSSDEYLQYAINNRAEWEQKGEQLVKQLIQKVTQKPEYQVSMKK